MFKSLQKTQRLLLAVICCFQFLSILGCVHKDIILPARSSINYDSQGYLEVCIGPYKLYLPSRFEARHKLISKINRKTSTEPFNGKLQIDIPNKIFFLEAKDYHLFAMIEQPIIDRHEYPGGETRYCTGKC